MQHPFHGTTILAVRRADKVVIGGDGQATMGDMIAKDNIVKVRRLYKNKVIAGFAGATADAFSLFERFEAKLAQLATWMKAHQTALRPFTTPTGSILSIGVLMLLSLVISRWLSSLLCVLWLAAIGRWVHLTINAKKDAS